MRASALDGLELGGDGESRFVDFVGRAPRSEVPPVQALSASTMLWIGARRVGPVRPHG